MIDSGGVSVLHHTRSIRGTKSSREMRCSGGGFTCVSASGSGEDKLIAVLPCGSVLIIGLIYVLN